MSKEQDTGFEGRRLIAMVMMLFWICVGVVTGFEIHSNISHVQDNKVISSYGLHPASRNRDQMPSQGSLDRCSEP